MFGWFKPKITDDMVERATRAMWDVWQSSDACRDEVKGISWDTMLANAPMNDAAYIYVTVGRMEAREALRAALRTQ